jgi:ATP-dependent Lon protease
MTEMYEAKTASDENPADPIRMPEQLPILPLRNTVAFPKTTLPLAVGIPRSVQLVEDAVRADGLIGLVTMKNPEIKEPSPGETYETGTMARIEHVRRGEEEGLQAVVQGLSRFRIRHWVSDTPYLKASVEEAPDIEEDDVEMEALVRSLRELAQEVVTLTPHLPQEAADFLSQISDPGYLAFLVATNAGMKADIAQAILEEDSVKQRIHKLIRHLSHEREVLTLGKKIQTDAKEEIDRAQREYYLRQQLKAIQKELGEADATSSSSEVEQYRLKIEDARLPEEAEKEAERELKRLGSMSPQSAEYSVIKTYLDWLVDLPWQLSSEDDTDIGRARAVLDEDHYDLEEVKERLVEYLAVRALLVQREADGELPREKQDRTPDARGAILCFAGPPGVGKTSLGQSIARALGRKFTRMSLGGMRDEAEIRGHRRTYIGAMPGRIIQAIRRAGTRNPVFMLDEVDKIGMGWQGDPSSALLEVLDPAQNHAFRDHYLDVDFDLSDVIFITTANQLETIPAPLRDRMEIIRLDGYTEYEKLKIAQQHLVPRQRLAHGLREEEITFTDDALSKIVQDYTREAGVRNLERQIGSVCRKCVVKIMDEKWSHVVVTPEIVRETLKKEKFESEASENIEIPGIATGLAVTATGGDILFVEATRMPGKGKLTLTGQLGEVMRESAQIAHSYVRSKADAMEVDPGRFLDSDVHVHVPQGAIPKDGPSAGVAMVLSVASLFSGRPVRCDVGMTGEVTLRGRVLPVGGVKMKVLAAHRAGLTTVILPKRNEKDLDELPDEVRNTLLFVLVDRIDEALETALVPVELAETCCS